jgi:hypothetical protein
MPPGRFPTLFQSALDPPLLGALLAMVATAPTEHEAVRARVRAGARMLRFRTLVLLLKPRGVVAALGSVEGQEGVRGCSRDAMGSFSCRKRVSKG